MLAVAVPLFNDTMLGVSCQTVQSLCQGGSDSLYGYQIPVGNLYNFLMAIALVLLGVGALLAFMGRVAIGTGEKNNIIMDSVVGVAVILLFPLIYNFVGSIVDYVDQAVIAYPNDYQTYGNALQSVWNQFPGSRYLELVERHIRRGEHAGRLGDQRDTLDHAEAGRHWSGSSSSRS